MNSGQGFEEKQILVSGLEVNYKIVGQGPTILILHGWGSKSDRWAQVSKLLSQHNFSVIVPDLSGFGKSSIPPVAWNEKDYCRFIEQFVGQLGLKEFYLLGHSFGGGLGAVYAATFPHRVKKLLLFASAIVRRGTLKEKVFWIISKVFKVFSFVPFYSLFRKAVYKYFIDKSDYPYTSGIMRETYLKVMRNDLSHYLPSIKVPTLIIWGDRDDVVPLQDAYFIQNHIQSSRVAIIPGGDHNIERHMPEQLVAKITTFLRP
ncbi:MAG: alpha/beta hydrolase [bacterium]|nr:alpha/beta hydrolase [bacterium]